MKYFPILEIANYYLEIVDQIVDQTETLLVKEVRAVRQPGVGKDTFFKDTLGLLVSLGTLAGYEGVAPVRIDEPISVLSGHSGVFDVLDLFHHVFECLRVTAGDINLLLGIILQIKEESLHT